MNNFFTAYFQTLFLALTYGSYCSAHLPDYDYNSGIDPGLLPPLPAQEQTLPASPPSHRPHATHTHSHHKRQTSEDMGNTGDEEDIKTSEDIEKSDNNEAELAVYNGTGMQTADIYSGAGCHPPYLCPQGMYNPLYSNPAYLPGPYPNPSMIGNPAPFLYRPYYPSRYPYQGYPNRYNIYRNTFLYPRYPAIYGKYH